MHRASTRLKPDFHQAEICARSDIFRQNSAATKVESSSTFSVAPKMSPRKTALISFLHRLIFYRMVLNIANLYFSEINSQKRIVLFRFVNRLTYLHLVQPHCSLLVSSTSSVASPAPWVHEHVRYYAS